MHCDDSGTECAETTLRVDICQRDVGETQIVSTITGG